MKTFLPISILVFSVIASLAQPAFTIENFNIKTDEKDKYYERQATRCIQEKGQPDKSYVADEYFPGLGLYYAIYGLKTAEKKGTIASMQQLVSANFSTIHEANLEIVKTLLQDTEEFKDDQTVTDKARIVNYYQIMNLYGKAIATIPSANMAPANKKGARITLTPMDFSKELEKAKVALDEAKEAAASMHYAAGRQNAMKQGIAANKAAAKCFRYAMEYIPGYRDAESRYEECRKLGTMRLGITDFSSSNSEFGNLGAVISTDILKRFDSDRNRFEFFEVIDRNATDKIISEQKLSLSGLMDESTTAEIGEIAGVNAIIVGSIGIANVDREQLSPERMNYKKNVKVGEETYMEDGKEKKRDVKQDVTYTNFRNRKISSAHISVNYKIIDVSTGKVIDSGERSARDSWEYVWFSDGSGDQRAKPSLQNTQERPFISSAEQMAIAASKVASSIYSDIAKYGREVSQ